jgi:hypothetical protein
MLGFLSFIVVLAILSGTVGMIVTMIRNASGQIFTALRADVSQSVTFVTFRARPIRQTVQMRVRSAPLRAAA